MNSYPKKNKASKDPWLSLSQVAPHTPYSSEYLSLLARQKKLPAKKINNVWHTTTSALDDYIKKQAIRALVQRGDYDTIRLEEARTADLPLNTSSFKRMVIVLPLLVLMISAGFFLFGQPSLALAQTHQESPNTFNFNNQQVASVFRGVNNFFDGVISGFRLLSEITWDSIFPPREPAPLSPAPPPQGLTRVVVTQVEPLDLLSLKDELQRELEVYVRSQIALRAPTVVYQSLSTSPATTLQSLNTNEVQTIVYRSIARQSDSDASRISTNLSNITNEGTFTSPTLTDATITGATFPSGLTVSGGGASITGDLTINGNTIVSGGSINVGDKIISPGDIGVGTTTPYGKLSVQGTLATQPTFVLYGVENQTADLVSIYDNPTSNTNFLTITSAGKVGVGTNSPVSTLDVRGTLTVDDNSASPNTIITGRLADVTITGTENTYINLWANSANTITGSQNTALGAGALNVNTSGARNTAIGTYSLVANTTGNWNTALGYQSLNTNQGGGANVALGYRSLFSNISSSNNVAIGTNAGSSATGANNIFLGTGAGDNITTGSNNIVLGYDIDAPAVDSSNILNIGNLIFGTGIDGTGTTLSTGSVGIGTTTPTSLLQVAGATAPKFTLSDTNASANQKHWFIESDTGKFSIGTTSDALVTNSAYRALTIDSSGNVGIGTESPASSLQIGSGQVLVPDGTTAAPSLAFSTIPGTGWYLGFGTRPSLASSGTTIYEYSGVHIFTGIVSAGSFAPTGLTASPFFQLNTPQVGYNFTGRNSSTQDGGDVWIIAGTPGATSAGSAIRLRGSVGSGTNQNGGIVDINGGAPTGTGLYGNIILAGTGGNVGIGTTSPYAKLSVHANNGETNRTLFAIASSTASATTTHFTVLNSGNVGIGTVEPAYALDVLASGTGVIARFNSTNATGCTLADGGTITCTSDERMKKNIEDNTFGLETVMSLRPVLFNWNYENDDLTKNLGFLAQEVEVLVPKLVVTDENGMKSLNTTGMIPIIVKALQDIWEKIAPVLAWFDFRDDLLCVDDVCVTKEEFKALLLNAGGTATVITNDVTNDDVEVVAEEDAESAPSTDSEQATTTEEIIVEEDNASTTPEVIEEEEPAIEEEPAVEPATEPAGEEASLTEEPLL